MARATGVPRFGHAGLDGTKVWANASRRAMSSARIEFVEARLKSEASRLLEFAEVPDRRVCDLGDAEKEAKLAKTEQRRKRERRSGIEIFRSGSRRSSRCSGSSRPLSASGNRAIRPARRRGSSGRAEPSLHVQ